MIQSLSLRNFRNFSTLNLDFQSGNVLLCGANGQGKTSILESLFYLSTLRSFRTGKVQEMIKLNTAGFQVASEVSFGSWNKRFEVELSNVRRLKIDGNSVSRASEFAGAFNLVTFLPDDPEIVNGRGLIRRKFLDMFISMLDREYFSSLQKYSLALKSRNLLIRNHEKDDELLKAYHPVLARTGSEIIRKRIFHVRILSDFMAGILSEIRPELADFHLHLHTAKDAADEAVFQEKLNRSLEHDRMKGFTLFGPQSDDFDFVADSKSLRLYGSRGQCRIVSFALKLAEFDIIRNHDLSKNNTIVMVDDATGDLDPKAEDAFYAKIESANQVFYTFTDLPETPVKNHAQIIHVTAGKAVCMQ